MKTEPVWKDIQSGRFGITNSTTNYLGFDAYIAKRERGDKIDFFVNIRRADDQFKHVAHYAEADTLEEAKQKATDAMHTLAGISEQRQLEDALRVILSTALITLAVTLITILIIGVINA